MRGGGEVAVIDRPEPTPSNDLVAVRIMVSALCGSERHAYYGRGPRAENGGHEAAGVVEVVGPSVRHVHAGDRVMIFASSPCGRCRYCLAGRWILCRNPIHSHREGMHTQVALVRDELCFPIPDDVPFEVAALLADALGTPYRALRRLTVTALDTVLVLGQGPIGLAATTLARFLGAQVVAVDVNDYRLRRAEAAGATRIVNPRNEDLAGAVAEFTGGEGVDVALECSATAEGAVACVDAVRPTGRVAMIGLTGKVTLDLTSQLILRDVTLVGTWYSDPADLPELMSLVRRGLDVGQLVTHRYGIDEAPEAFRTFFGGQAVKVILEPNR